MTTRYRVECTSLVSSLWFSVKKNIPFCGSPSRRGYNWVTTDDEPTHRCAEGKGQ